jgi:hypothetical protein
VSAHLDRLGVRSEDRGDYIEHLLRARVELRRAMNLEGPSAGHADPPSEACHAASRLSVALDRLGCPPTMGVADYLLREGRDRY